MQLTHNQQGILNSLRARRNAPNLFSTPELACFLEISVRSIRRMQAADKAPPRSRRSRALMYPVDGVLEWLPGYISSIRPSAKQYARDN